MKRHLFARRAATHLLAIVTLASAALATPAAATAAARTGPTATARGVSAAAGPTATARGASAAAGPAPTANGLTVEGVSGALGIDTPAPRLGWLISSNRRGVVQSAYQVRVASTAAKLSRPDVWDSGRTAGAESTQVAYGGPALTSATRYHWQVRVWDADGRASAWSEPSWWETGLLKPEDWHAKWIGRERPSASWSDYTVDLRLTVTRDAAGVFFRAKGVNDAYMWQLANFGNVPVLRPHVRVGGSWQLLKEVPVPIAPGDFNKPHDLRIETAGTTIKTFVDGVQVDTTVDSRRTTGTIGLRTSGTETAVVHSVKLTVGGKTEVDADLTKTNPFTAGTLTPTGLEVTGNLETLLADPAGKPLLRREFPVDRKVSRARVYSTALGVYELSLNGRKVGDHQLAPGWTDYTKRVQYQTFDVTDQLVAGTNTIGAMLGDGWYSGSIGWFGDKLYGERPELLAELRIDYTDGTSQTIGTDGTWRSADGPVLRADNVHGETYDARLEPQGWRGSAFDDAAWSAATVRTTALTQPLIAQVDPPVKVTQELAAKTLTQPKPGVWVFDLGQNMVGATRLRVSGTAGQTVRIRHAEVLNPDGTVYTANLRTAQATDYYTLDGSGAEVYEPRFTFHGFRYVELTGFPGTPTLSTVTGRVMGTAAPFSGDLITSDPMVNQLQSNIVWGQRGNFLSVPTDTPARDERLGWTGDINVFAETATFNMDSLSFLTKWLADLRDAQSANGAYPDVAPRQCCGDGASGWADAGITVPYVLWKRYGDTKVLAEHYDSMRRYIDYVQATSDGLLRPNAGPYLDWLNLDDPTPAGVIGTAYAAYSTRLFAEMAAALGRTDDATKYGNRATAVTGAFAAAYVSADGKVQGDSQTAYVLALSMGLVPAERRAAAGRQLAAKVAERGYHLSTGFLGTPDLLPALSDTGSLDIAYRLLLNKDYPSWGYEIARGATTVWERWDSIKPDGSFGDVGMNSFNHYAYGAVGDWMYRTIGGLQPDDAAPGFKHFTIAPKPGGGLTSAKATYRSRYGQIASGWKLDAAGQMSLDVTVPGNTTATVEIPAASRWAVTEGGKPSAQADGVKFVKMAGGNAVFTVGSGTYRFAVDSVRGDLGESRVAAAAVADLITEGSAADRRPNRCAWPVATLLAKALVVTTEAADRGYGTASPAGTATTVHLALATAADLDRWVGTELGRKRLAEPAATEIRAKLTDVRTRLSRVSAALVGAVASLGVPAGDLVPGDVVRVEAKLQNKGSAPLTDVRIGLPAPAGWTSTRVGPAPATTVRPGGTVSAFYDVRIGSGQQPGSVDLAGTVSYQRLIGSATLPLAASITVAPAIEITKVTAASGSVIPGGTTEVSVVLRNRSTLRAQGDLKVSWSAGDRTYDLAAGQERTVVAPVTAPLSVTEGAVTLTATAGGATAGVDVRVVVEVPPPGALDHADLGNGASEQAHRLTASAQSGTNTEAGLTRRYTQQGVAGGYFEFDLAVPPGQPFLLRTVETYNQPQVKDYDILVDGVPVHARSYRRTATGEGTVGYQILVDRADLTADGTVRVRFQEDAEGRNYDPSIADVWSLPVTTG
ncbi:family 78 glycoside hydrolase catalytic domain [Actinoplanes solisilvae]|uniref:family 78 glycoside hydrolase catalytic domain n=1 Tax=Actinoplanes solisilvae TaxID=2486853 RepID=UPI00196B652D|nr:family 78 glycoside hydrolase catalytic domain [Actinoplanes solisilvae]